MTSSCVCQTVKHKPSLTCARLLGQAAAEPAAHVAVKKEEEEATAAARPSEDAHAVGLLDRLAGVRRQRILALSATHTNQKNAQGVRSGA